jgi:hypothetical protein
MNITVDLLRVILIVIHSLFYYFFKVLLLGISHTDLRKEINITLVKNGLYPEDGSSTFF